MNTFFFIKVVALIMCFISSFNIFAQKKVALIIGNQNYDNVQFEVLPTCINDANEMSRVLNSLGYTTMVVSDGNKDDILRALDIFSNIVKDSDVAVFFYSGHAIRLERDLYIVPSKTQFFETSLNDQLVNFSNIREVLESNSQLSLLFMDACRAGATTNNPIGSKGRKRPSNKRRNDEPLTPKGCMVCYATQDGRTASVGNENLSPFTKAIVSHLTDTDEFRTVWENIVNDAEIYAPEQHPSIEDSYTNNFYFNPIISKNDSNNTLLISEGPNAMIDFSVLNINEIEDYANKGYVNAYIAAAKYYIKNALGYASYEKAYFYALKSLESNANIEQTKIVFNQLDSLGFFDISNLNNPLK